MIHTTIQKMKFKRLQRRLGLKMFEAVGILEMLWMFTAMNSPRGDIGKFSNEEIAAFLEYPGNEDALISALVDSGWLDKSEPYRLLVHDWTEHCPNFIKGALARKGEKFAEEAETPEVQPKRIDLRDTTSEDNPQGSDPLNQTKPNQTKPTQTKAERSLQDTLLAGNEAVRIYQEEIGCNPEVQPLREKQKNEIASRITGHFDLWREVCRHAAINWRNPAQPTALWKTWQDWGMNGKPEYNRPTGQDPPQKGWVDPKHLETAHKKAMEKIKADEEAALRLQAKRAKAREYMERQREAAKNAGSNSAE